MSNNTNILLRHNFVAVPSGSDKVGEMSLATVMVNLSYYGYGLDVGAYQAVSKLSPSDFSTWWNKLETELKDLTGASRKMGNFVVYKNFPKEVLDKSEAEYWIPQILMYWGFPNEYFTQPVVPRDKMSKQKRPRILRLAKSNTLDNIFNSYLASSARWKDQDQEDVLFLADSLPVNLAKVGFKKNMIILATWMMNNNKQQKLSSATDVLRLAAGLSNGDISLRTSFKFISFKKPVRRFLLGLLNNCNNLEEDVARRPELFKRLFHQLHPGDYKKRFPKVCSVNDDLYNDRLETFNSKVEQLLLDNKTKALDLLSERPGDFRRRLVHTVDLFGNKAVKAFTKDKVLDKLTTNQVVFLRTYLETVNTRLNRVFPPRGNWTKAQVGEARWVEEKHVKNLTEALTKVLEKRLPKVKVLDEATRNIKLASNDGEVSPYARGTAFPIPEDVDFIRSASYWAFSSYGNIWYDNGWNFFASDWKQMGAICWDKPNYGNGSAAFSGDPTSSKTADGKACQLIDLYPAKLKQMGIRYAVWNILCYSNKSFSEAQDVFAALQWGNGAQTGKLFEPSRNQLAFPLKSESKTKYIALLDLHTNQMIYLDANLKGNVSSASTNSSTLEKMMPPFMEYLNSLPSVHDLFRQSVDSKSNLQVLYSDKDIELKDVSAYVFKPENKNNKYQPMDLNGLLLK